MFDRTQLNYFEKPEREKEITDNLDRFDGDVYATKYLTNTVNPEFIKTIRKYKLNSKPSIRLINVVFFNKKYNTKDLV